MLLVGVIVLVGVTVLVGVLVGVIVIVGVILLVGVLVGVAVGVCDGAIVGHVNSNWNSPPIVSVVTWTITIVGVFAVFIKLFSYKPLIVVDDITILEFQITCTLEFTSVSYTILIFPVFKPTSNVYIWFAFKPP